MKPRRASDTLDQMRASISPVRYRVGTPEGIEPSWGKSGGIMSPVERARKRARGHPKLTLTHPPSAKMGTRNPVISM